MLKGKRVYLRLLEQEDLPYRVHWLNDEEISSGITIDGPVSLAMTKAWFQKVVADPSRKHFVIVENKNELPIGIIGLVDIDYRNQKAELYIAIGNKEYWGKGIGTEASELLIEYTFQKLNLNRIYLYTSSENVKAQKLYEKIGMLEEGTLRKHKFHKGILEDYKLFGMLKAEWVERNSE